eukprot:TRINITY_DN1002_c0_g1_i5.p1 TRINITY_DN1002_c0_g1~~TRINITY_DN1002_c0_g1_i5.p1  ORF type:complete len:241 (-),score=75.05 TRINITY_DN1002_c0_g1_i5:88-810(-)
MPTALLPSAKRNWRATGRRFDAREDILSRFMALGESNVVELRDAVINFILAGRDTTAQTLTWLTYFLACSPHLQDELLAEIQEHCADEITLDSLKKLSLCQAAMDETLRLRPPVPIDIKTAVGDDRLPSGVHVPAGSLVLWSAYIMGHHEQLWKNPLKFDPHRWLDNDHPIHPHNAIPFQAGPRLCLGQNFAYVEVKTLLCLILPKFRFEVAKDKPAPEIASGVTLSARDGVHLRVTRRK